MFIRYYHFILVVLLLSAPALCGEDDALSMNLPTAKAMTAVVSNETTLEKMRAAMALGSARVKYKNTILALNKLAEDPYAPARASAIYALGRSRSDRALDAVMKALKDKDALVRVEACRAVTELQSPALISTLPVADPSPLVRLAAIDAIRQLEAKDAAAMLIAQYDKEKEPSVRAALLRCLSILRTGEAVTAKGINDADLAVKRAALLWITACKGNKEKFEAHVQPLLKHKAMLIRQAAVQAWVTMLGKDAAPALAPMAKDQHQTVRRAVALAFGTLKDKAFHELLHTLQADPVRLVRRAASFAIADPARENDELRISAEAMALKAVNADNPDLQREGLWVLGHIRSQAGFPAIMKLAHNDIPKASEKSEVDCRASALVMWVIAESKHVGGATLAMKYLDCANGSLRVQGARALGSLRHAPATGLLARTLKKTVIVEGMPMFVYSGLERTYAIKALGAIGNAEATTPLLELLCSVLPQDTSDNLTLMQQLVAKAKPANTSAVLQRGMAKCRSGKNKSPSHEAFLADTIELVTGTRPMAPPTKERKPYDYFFLNVKDEK